MVHTRRAVLRALIAMAFLGAGGVARAQGCDNGVLIGGTACQYQGDSVEYVCQPGSFPGASIWSSRSCNGGTCQGAACTTPPAGCDNGVAIGGTACNHQGDSVEYVCQPGSHPGASIWSSRSCNGGTCQGAACTAPPAGCDNGVTIGGTACNHQGDSVEYVCQPGSHPGANIWSPRSCNGGTCQGAACTTPAQGCDNGVAIGGTACNTQGDSVEYVCQPGSYPGASVWLPRSCDGGTCQGAACSGSMPSPSCSVEAQSALDWEALQLATPYAYAGSCLSFVYGAYQVAGDVPYWLAGPDAATSLAAARTDPGWAPWNGSCPCGAVIYWDASSCNGWNGHVAICQGDGTVSSSGWYGNQPWPGGTQTIGWMSQMECNQPPAGYICPDGNCQGGGGTCESITDVAACDAAGCAYYYCADSCRPQGSDICQVCPGYPGCSNATCDNGVPIGGTACNQDDRSAQFICVDPGQPSALQWARQDCDPGQQCAGTSCQPVSQCEAIADVGACDAAGCAYYYCALSNPCRPQGSDICQVCPGYDGCSTSGLTCDNGVVVGGTACNPDIPSAQFVCVDPTQPSASQWWRQECASGQRCEGTSCRVPDATCRVITSLDACNAAGCAWYACAPSNPCRAQGSEICLVCPGYQGCTVDPDCTGTDYNNQPVKKASGEIACNLAGIEYVCGWQPTNKMVDPTNPWIDTCVPCAPSPEQPFTDTTCSCAGSLCGDTTCDRATATVSICQSTGWEDTGIACGESPYVYGAHDPADPAFRPDMEAAARKGWLAYSVDIGIGGPTFGIDPNFEAAALDGYGVIVRLNNGHAESDPSRRLGTLPCPADTTAFKDRVVEYVKTAHYVHVWVVGNEPNLDTEQPNCGGTAQPITADRYASVFKLVRSAIQAIPAHAGDQVLVAGLTPSGAAGYFQDVMARIGSDLDGIAVHAYTPNGYVFSQSAMANNEAICRGTVDAMIGDFASIVSGYSQNRAIYITEVQPGSWPGEYTGWIRTVYRGVDAWNSAHPLQPVRAAALFGTSGWPSGNEDDLRHALEIGYVFPRRSTWP